MEYVDQHTLCATPNLSFQNITSTRFEFNKTRQMNEKLHTRIETIPAIPTDRLVK